MKKLAIVILNWNGQHYLEKFLPALLQNIPEYAEGLITAQWHTAITNSDLIWQGATPTGDGLTEEVEYLVPAGSLQPLRFFRLKVRLME